MVKEAYRDYKPPGWVRPTVERLLDAVPATYLAGLDSVVLKDSAAVGMGKTQRVRGRKYDRRACRGFYRRRHAGIPASIEIVVDNVVAEFPSRFFAAFNFFRDVVIGNVLFHELGHHLDATLGAAAPSGEAAAEDWRERLSGSYFRARYWWLRPFARFLSRVMRWIQRSRLNAAPKGAKAIRVRQR